MKLKYIIAASVLLLSTTACQQGNAAINPVASAYDSTVQRNDRPTTTLRLCHQKTETLFIDGKVYVINKLVCEDDHGRTIIVT